MESIIADILFIGKGTYLTITLLVCALFIGLIMGILLSILQYNKIGQGIIKRYISLLRGTPLLLQLSLIYFASPGILGIKLNILTAGIIALGVNSSAYMAEIMRAGIQSVPKGQFEAAKTLEIPQYQTWRDIILPQVIRNIFPSLINEVISLLKETALIGTIGGMDIMRMAQTLGAQQFTYFRPLCVAAVYYYLLVLIVEFVGKYVEKRRWYAKG